MGNDNYFKEITLLITHYNRSSSLERLLDRFYLDGFQFEDIIISDDSSNNFHMEVIKNLQSKYKFRLVTTPVNKGLANNINKGQDQIKTPLTLYVQEDFVPKPEFKEKLRTAVSLFDEIPDLDIIRFYAYFKHPFLIPYRDGFSEMKFNIWSWGYRKFWLYSDHPHLRKSNFLEKFGRYREGMGTEEAEYKMMINFLKKKGKAFFYDDFKGLFDQINSSKEPSTVKRNYWRNSNNFLVKAIRETYRHLKFNIDYIR